jgi:anti-anti-sigma factor
MFKVAENKKSIIFTLSSEVQLADSVIKESQRFLKQFDISEFSGFKLVLRELLNNAVEHGNYNLSDRTVVCRIEYIGDKRFKITVQDEGKGFDYGKLVMTLPEDPRQIRNRGYALVNAFSDQIDFNDKGNRVTVYVTFMEETVYSIERRNDWQIIVPSGDLTAATADNFRIRLIELLDKGHSRYRFNFQNVADIDSVSLSVLIIFARTLSSKEETGKLEVVNMNRDLQDLFHMTRMDQLYSIVSRL